MQDHKSIEQLENDYWKDIEFPTGLVERCYKYRSIPIRDLTVEQIRTLISQNIGIEYLLPKALTLLRKNVLEEGDLYPGDLLSSVLNNQEWPDVKLKQELKLLLKEKRPNIEKNNEANEHRQILKQIDSFLLSR